MSIIVAIIVGLIVGIIAKFLMPGRDPGGFFVTALIGIVGAALATFIGRQLGWYDGNEAAGFIASVIGAMLLLLLYRMVAGRSRRTA